MAVRDVEAFLRERAALYDPNLDLSAGAPFDVQVIQPLVRRLGTDPFTVDMATFIDTRLRQAYEGEIAVDEGDALTDLLVKPATLIFDPLVREVTRVRQNLSFKDPSTLTLEEAESLGGNLFSERRTGDFARGQGRIFFSQPQGVTVSPVNFVTSKGGLRFFPTEVQTIRAEEMLLNLDDDGTYYFDINLIAENEGEEYNLAPSELISIANIAAAVRLTNLRRFRRGEPSETAEEFVERSRGDLTERSLVTLRGIAAKTTKAFPEVRRLNVVGFQDPEMNRDIITGGGLGPVVDSGVDGAVQDDGLNQTDTSRMRMASANFLTTIGAVGPAPDNVVITMLNVSTDVTAGTAVDFDVVRVIDDNTIEVSPAELNRTPSSSIGWLLRKRELTLSGIPGGILFPDNANGTVTIDPTTVHIGGMTDMYFRGTGVDEATLLLDSVSDDEVELSGLQAQPFGSVFTLTDIVLGVDYQVNDSTYLLLERAGRDSLTLQIVTGPDPSNLGSYRVASVVQTASFSPVVTVVPGPAVPDLEDYRWRLFDVVNVDLVEPKETRVSGTDLSTVQNSAVVVSALSTDFVAFGAAEGDTLRLLSGPDAGDFTLIEDPVVLGQLTVDAVMKSTTSNVEYTVFRPNADGGLVLPLVRITQINLLDSTNQPVGSVVPYANPVDIQSRAFQNPARGVKHELLDVQLGIISINAVGVTTGGTLNITVLEADGTLTSVTVTFGVSDTLQQVIDLINTEVNGVIPGSNPAFAFDASRFAIRPVGVGLSITTGSELLTLFGTLEPQTTADVRSATVNAAGPDVWDDLIPGVDYLSGLDIVQVISGNQVGFYGAPFSGPESTNRQLLNGGVPSRALVIIDITALPDERTRQFAPEENVQVVLGSRSLGSARLFFLDPTSFEVGRDTVFEVTTEESGTLRFLPDPSLDYQIVPPLPSSIKSNDGITTGSTLVSAGGNFQQQGVEPGDRLVIDFIPLVGTQAMADPIVGLSTKTMVLSVNNGPDITVTFFRDDISLSPNDVSLSAVADQINAKVGIDIASIVDSDKLQLQASVRIAVKSGTALTDILGDVKDTAPPVTFGAQVVTNDSPHAGNYLIVSVVGDTLTVPSPFPPEAPYTAPINNTGFLVFRANTQRITTTVMAQQQAEASLYYADIELVSEGVGDQWNIPANLQMKASGYRSDGYFLTTDDENLSFSLRERPRLHISKSILEDGVDDSPANATVIVGQNLSIAYERSQLIGDVQSFILSDTERVVNENPLSRHLVPHFVRFDLTYTGGSKEDVIRTDLEKYLRERFPADPLEVGDINGIVKNRGASAVENPIDLIAVVHDIDRSIQIARSQNSLTTGRLAAFEADILNITRDLT